MRGIDCAHSQTLKMLSWLWFREGISVLKRKSNIFGFLWENRRFLGFSRRRIDCAHSRSLKMLPWSWFREMNVLYWSENMKILAFSKIIVLRVILCEKSIQRIPEVSKCIFDHRPWKIMFLPQRLKSFLFKTRIPKNSQPYPKLNTIDFTCIFWIF